MRVLLIKVGGFNTNISVQKTEIGPPLGILYLASYLRKFRGDQVRIYDMRIASNTEQLWQLLTSFKPQVTGLSFFTCDSHAAHKLAAMIKTWQASMMVVAGGPHASMYPYRTMLDTHIDYLIQGDGEEAFCELLDALEKKTDLLKIAGVAGRMAGQVFFNPQHPRPVNLDQLPMPAWDLYDPHIYAKTHSRFTLIHDYRPYASIFATRGCPYHCSFCHNIFGKRLRKRSISNVIQEMEYLKNCGVESIEFFDDSINADPGYLRSLLKAIIRARLALKISFPNGLRSDLVTRDDLKLLKAAQCIFISMAVESASPRIQKLIRKNIDLERIQTNIRESAKLRIFTNGYFMLGFPTETRQEMEATIKFANHSALHTAIFSTVVPHPATRLGQIMGLNEMDVPIEEWNYHKGVCNISAETAEVVSCMQRKAYRNFYMNPRRILRIANNSPSLKKSFHGFSIMVQRILPYKKNT